MLSSDHRSNGLHNIATWRSIPCRRCSSDIQSYPYLWDRSQRTSIRELRWQSGRCRVVNSHRMCQGHLRRPSRTRSGRGLGTFWEWAWMVLFSVRGKHLTMLNYGSLTMTFTDSSWRWELTLLLARTITTQIMEPLDGIWCRTCLLFNHSASAHIASQSS